MISINQIRTRTDLLKYYQEYGKGALLESAFFLRIEGAQQGYFKGLSESDKRSDKVHVTSLTVPNIGLGFKTGDIVGLVETEVRRGPVTFVYNLPAGKSAVEKDPFLMMYSNSAVHSSGVPIYIPINQRPVLVVGFTGNGLKEGARNEVFDIDLVKFVGCKFSYPQLKPNLSGKGATSFSVSVEYSDYQIL